MDSVQDYEACVQIETARCELRDSCERDFDVETCVTYYREYCRTRKIAPDYTQEQVDQCTSDIETYSCSELSDGEPETCEISSCMSLLCEQTTDDSDQNSDEIDTADSDSEVTSGLQPAGS